MFEELSEGCPTSQVWVLAVPRSTEAVLWVSSQGSFICSGRASCAAGFSAVSPYPMKLECGLELLTRHLICSCFYYPFKWWCFLFVCFWISLAARWMAVQPIFLWGHSLFGLSSWIRSYIIIDLTSYISLCSVLCVQTETMPLIIFCSLQKAANACCSWMAGFRKSEFVLLEGCEQKWWFLLFILLWPDRFLLMFHKRVGFADLSWPVRMKASCNNFISASWVETRSGFCEGCHVTWSARLSLRQSRSRWPFFFCVCLKLRPLSCYPLKFLPQAWWICPTFPRQGLRKLVLLPSLIAELWNKLGGFFTVKYDFRFKTCTWKSLMKLEQERGEWPSRAKLEASPIVSAGWRMVCWKTEEGISKDKEAITKCFIRNNCVSNNQDVYCKARKRFKTFCEEKLNKLLLPREALSKELFKTVWSAAVYFGGAARKHDLCVQCFICSCGYFFIQAQTPTSFSLS